MSRWMPAAAPARSRRDRRGVRHRRPVRRGGQGQGPRRGQGPGTRRAHDLPVAALHRSGQARNDRRVRGDDRRRRQVRRGDQRQQRVLREAPSAARARRHGRPQPDHGERLARGPHVQARLPPALRLLPAREREAEPASRHCAIPPPTPACVHRPVAERHDRPDRPLGPGAGRRRDRRSVRPEVQGQGHAADRDARHRADDAEEHGHRSRARRRASSGSTRSTRSPRRRTPARSGKFTGNDYIKDLPKGDTWIALGWSGDAIQLQKDNPAIGS